MRIIHTSDWHLGQNFINKSREAEHCKFLEWLLGQLKEHQVDTLVVAGDIFDTRTPPSYARKIYFDFLKEIKGTGCQQVIVVGGNHDRASTLNESGSVLELLDIIVVGGIKEHPEQLVHLLKNREGQVAGVICAIPFLRDRDVRISMAGEDADAKSEALRKGITSYYQDAFKEAQRLSDLNGGIPILATGHLTMVGGELTEGVRELYIGTLSGYSEKDFPEGFDYIALGHLHKKQILGHKGQIRYCGTPIPLSFMEAKYPRVVNLVDLKRGEAPVVRELEVPLTQQLLSISGDMEQIKGQLESLTVPDKTENNDCNQQKIWLEVEVLDKNLELDLTMEFEEIIKELPVELLRIRRIRKDMATASLVVESEKLHEMSVEEVFSKRLEIEEMDDEKKSELMVAFKQTYHKVMEDQI